MNGIAPTYKPVAAELPPEYQLKIVQEQVQQQMIAIYSFEAAARALPLDDPQLPQIAANVARSRAILEGYRKIEAELIGRLCGA